MHYKVFDPESKVLGQAVLGFKSAANQEMIQPDQGNVGTYEVGRVEQNHLKLILNTPYPPGFWYGAIYGFARAYSASFVVHYEDISMRNVPQGKPVILHLVVEQ